MKKTFEKFIEKANKVCTENIFGQIANVLLFGGVLLTCCAIPAGVGCLAFAATGYLLSIGKIALDNRNANLEEKYFSDELEVSDYQPESKKTLDKVNYVESKNTTVNKELEK